MKNSLLVLCLAILSFSCSTDDNELRIEQCDCTKTIITYHGNTIVTQEQEQLIDNCDNNNLFTEREEGVFTITESWDCN